MRVTVLGTGDALGMPVPLCDCPYCADAEERRRAAVMVESGDTTLAFDAGPDLREQLVKTGKERIDAFFLTHGHDDHLAGVLDLQKLWAFADEDVTLVASDSVLSYTNERFPWLDFPTRRFEPGETVRYGDLTVTAFPVEHSSAFPEQGYVVSEGNRSLVYVPDLWSFGETTVHEGADLLFVDGLYLFGKVFEDDDDHAGPERLRSEIESAAADRVVLSNVSEHHHQATTEELRERAGEYEIWSDFDSVTLDAS